MQNLSRASIGHLMSNRRLSTHLTTVRQENTSEPQLANCDSEFWIRRDKLVVVAYVQSTWVLCKSSVMDFGPIMLSHAMGEKQRRQVRECNSPFVTGGHFWWRSDMQSRALLSPCCCVNVSNLLQFVLKLETLPRGQKHIEQCIWCWILY